MVALLPSCTCHALPLVNTFNLLQHIWMSLSLCLSTTIRVTESVGQRIWHKEQRSLAQSPCFPPDLQQDLPSVPQLLAVCQFLLGCPLFPLPLTRSGSSPYKLPVSETLQSHCLTFYPDTQAECCVPPSVCTFTGNQSSVCAWLL